MKLITILGARPQFIKAGIVSKIIEKNNQFEELIVHTGQHFDKNMSQIFFDQLDIAKPKYNLNINQMGHGQMTGLMLIEIEKILLKEKPQGVIVYGDTNSTLAGSLAASKLNIPIFHIEAGLRSFNMAMPEEINRILTDKISTLLFCPTENAVNLLNKEGIKEGVVFTGDVMYDLFLSIPKNKIEEKNPFILFTLHRPSNIENPNILKSIFSDLDKINSEIKVIFPIHPGTEKKLKQFKIKSNIETIPPLGYQEMVRYLINSELVITDSGGLQKEAFFAEKKCITLRGETEWIELINSGTNILCDTSKKSILEAYNKIKSKKCDFSTHLYGDGKAAIKIVDHISNFLIL